MFWHSKLLVFGLEVAKKEETLYVEEEYACRGERGRGDNGGRYARGGGRDQGTYYLVAFIIFLLSCTR